MYGQLNWARTTASRANRAAMSLSAGLSSRAILTATVRSRLIWVAR
jgi:hypothetical protein